MRAFSGSSLSRRPSTSIAIAEGFGAGNVPPGLVPAVEKAAACGIPVVLTTRCPEGGVWPMCAYPGGDADLVKRVVSGKSELFPDSALTMQEKVNSDVT